MKNQLTRKRVWATSLVLSVMVIANVPLPALWLCSSMRTTTVGEMPCCDKPVVATGMQMSVPPCCTMTELPEIARALSPAKIVERSSKELASEPPLATVRSLPSFDSHQPHICWLFLNSSKSPPNMLDIYELSCSYLI